MIKRKKHNYLSLVSHERWFISYADIVTLLLAVFVVLYSVSAIDKDKYKEVQNSLEKLFNSKNISIVRMSKDVKFPSKKDKIQSQSGDHWEFVSFEAMAKRIDFTFDDLIKRGLITVKTDPSFVEVSVNSSILFASGKAQLNDDAELIVAKLAKIFLQRPDVLIYVEGFTDSTPIATSLFPSNWELSSARSSSVVRLLAREGVNPKRMVALGYAEYQPLETNTTEQGRGKNRRVVLLVSRYIYQAGKMDSLINIRRPLLNQTLQNSTASNQKGF